MFFLENQTFRATVSAFFFGWDQVSSKRRSLLLKASSNFTKRSAKPGGSVEQIFFGRKTPIVFLGEGSILDTPWKINMEHNNGGGWKMIFLLKRVIVRFHVWKIYILLGFLRGGKGRGCSWGTLRIPFGKIGEHRLVTLW